MQITLKLTVPDGYRYLARQPFGDITIFKQRPVIVTEDGGSSYWALQDDELSLVPDYLSRLQPQGGDWKDSLVELRPDFSQLEDSADKADGKLD